ncbi:MAG TPA: TatD family hydrolase [Candidatus Eisenbacteria bacterium]|nr:TatD family hydrolase [Candidatus Eisenbacteria bacterium]
MDITRIDAHSHINFNAYKDDAEEVIRRAVEDGTGMLAVGSQITTSERATDYAAKHDWIWAVVGLHPTHLYDHFVDEQEIHYKSRNETFDPDAYRALAKLPKVVGIGECGLDYYRLPEGADHDAIKKKQHDTFREQLDLAHELDLPVMIHCRDAHGDVSTILEEYRDRGRPLRGDVHCFTGTWAEAERYLALGFYISFTGIVTFPPKAADKGKETLADVARRVPLERLLIETDAPYLAPVPHRGKRNEPAYVKHVGAFIAHLKGLETAEVEARTLQNTKDLFRLKF